MVKVMDLLKWEIRYADRPRVLPIIAQRERRGIDRAETGWILETNKAMNNAMEALPDASSSGTESTSDPWHPQRPTGPTGRCAERSSARLNRPTLVFGWYRGDEHAASRAVQRVVRGRGVVCRCANRCAVSGGETG